MTYIFKNRLGIEKRISDKEMEELRTKLPDSNTINIPIEIDDNYYIKDRYEES